MTTLLVLAKAPVPGRVKTRLTPPFTPSEAASLAEASLADTLEAVLAAPAERHVLLLNGEPGSWLPAGLDVVTGLSGGPADRITAAFERYPGPVLALGADTPQVTPGILAPALGPGAWEDCDAWIGPATDGGFWSLGLKRPSPPVLRGVPLSTPHTLARQYERLTAAGLTVRLLPRLRYADITGTHSRQAP